MTKNKSQVVLWSEGADHNGDFELAREAYVTSAIIRGLFHEKDAFEKGRSCHHHPIRRHMISHPIRDLIAPQDLRKVTEHHFTDPMKYLVSLIVTAPWKEKGQINRVSLWTENTNKVKSACLLNKLDPRFFECTEIDDKDAKRLAIDTAKDLKLRIYPKYYEEYIEYAETLFMECLGYIICPWLVPAAKAFEIGVKHLEKENPFSRKICEKIYSRDKRLDELTRVQAGQIKLDFPDGIF